MKRYLPILHKWTSLLSLILIPYYIHSARIDRILNKYTQKSNAIYIIIPVQKSDTIQTFPANDFILQANGNVEHIQFIIFHSHTTELKSISQTKSFYINSDIPPPNLI